jgi:hypothetical protein
MSGPRFGDLIENGWASTENPHRFGTFVRAGRRTGRLNPGPYWELTDRNGTFWETSCAEGSKLTNHGQVPIAYLRDAHEGEGDPCYVPAAKGDPGAFPVFAPAPTTIERGAS